MRGYTVFFFTILLITALITILFLLQFCKTDGYDVTKPPEKDSRFGIDENIVDSWDDVYKDSFNIE